MPALAIRVSTRCPHCQRVLPLNRFDRRFACRACLGHLDVAVDLWERLLHSSVEDIAEREQGDARSETRSIKGRTFELWTEVVASVGGATRAAAQTVRGITAFASEEAPIEPTADAIQVTCSTCGGVRRDVPAQRDFTCEFCQAASVISDRVWQRLHPEAAVKTWFLAIDDDAPTPTTKRAHAPFAVGDDMLAIEDGAIAAVSFGTRSALVRLDAKLGVRWRVDLAAVSGRGQLRLMRVGTEVWVADNIAHEATRHDLADGRRLGTIGGVEPVDAKQPAFDLRGLGDWVALADGSVMTLICNRFVRYQQDGTSIMTWPQKTGFLSRLFGAGLPPLYSGPPVEDDGDSLEPERAHTRMLTDDLGSPKPYTTGIAYRRLAADATSLWVDTGANVYRYGLDGSLLSSAKVPRGAAAAMVRPAPDARGGLYSVVFDDDNDRHMIAHTDAKGVCRLFATKGVRAPRGLMPSGDGLWIFGTQEGDVRHVAATGDLDHSSKAAIRADRDDDDDDDAEVE